MSRTPAQLVVDRLRQAGEVEKASDSDLLDAFVGQRSESAFAELVRRHGPMVWGVCWRMLARRADAEDCYQATFLVLLRKADTVRPQSRVGAWLHGVAYHIALKARHLAAKRGHMEQQVERLPEPISKPDANADMRQVLDSGLAGLPEKYRMPIVMCELEGRTLKEVARELGCPLGTLAGRLARGRDLLARRLAKHGAPAGAVAIAALVAETASAAPPVLALSSASPAVLMLAEAAIRTLFLARLQAWLLALTAALVVALGLGGGIYFAGAIGNTEAPPGNAAHGLPPAQIPEKLDPVAWGKPVEGVQYGLAFKENRKSYKIGEDVTFVIKARNVGGKPVSFEQAEIRNFDGGAGIALPVFADAKGKETMAFGALIPDLFIPARVRKIDLAVKETATLGEVAYRVGPFDNGQAGIDVTPGTYRVRFDTVQPGLKRPTGALEIEVLAQDKGALEATLSLGKEQTIRALYRNGTDKEVKVNKQVIANAVLALEVRDDAGKVVPPVSPPVPILENAMIVLAPGKEYSVSYGMNIFAPPLPPGVYRVRVRLADWKSNELLYVVSKEEQPKRKASLMELYVKIKPGMTRAEVEAVLGKPIIQDQNQPGGEVQVNYLGDEYRERTLLIQESPYAPSGISVSYVAGKLTKKSFNPQWVLQTAWGESVDGVEVGVEFKDKRNAYRVGEFVTMVVKARNLTDQPKKFTASGISQLGPLPSLTDGDGKQIKIVPQLAPERAALGMQSIKLGPKETATLGEATFTVGADDKPYMLASPGSLHIQYENISAPGDARKRPTGFLGMVVLERCAWGLAVDGVEYGFEFKAKNLPNRARIGDKATFILKVRNLTDKPITIEQVEVSASLGRTKDGKTGYTQPIFVDPHGKAVPGVPRIAPDALPFAEVTRIKIDARQTAILGEVTYTVGTSANPPFLPIEAGPYQVRFDSVSWLPGQQRATASAHFYVMPK